MPDLLKDLSPRQRQVAELIADGYTDKTIAAELSCSFGTLRSHLEEIADRLNLDRAKHLRVQITWLVIDARYDADPHYRCPIVPRPANEIGGR